MLDGFNPSSLYAGIMELSILTWCYRRYLKSTILFHLYSQFYLKFKFVQFQEVLFEYVYN